VSLTTAEERLKGVVAAADLRRERILVVDDDEGFRSMLSVVFRQAGYRAREAATGEEALELARRERPALVVLDVCLPGISGYEVCHELREAFGDRLPIVFVSGQRTESLDRVAGLLLGGDDYLVKPFAPDELLIRVHKLIRRAAPFSAAAGPRLTTRELDVLRLLADGLGQDEIAERLFISAKTVATHIEHILAKLGVRSRAQAVALAFRDQLVGSRS
jgi:DNA-binding NarL/FixJ family response regulator